jgi:hypothetical protein
MFISVLPCTALINAIIFSLNVLLSVIVEVFRELRTELALKEGPLEVVHSDHTAYQEECHWYHQNIQQVRYSHQESLYTYFESFVPGNDTQGAKDTKQSKDLNDFQLLAIQDDWECWSDDNCEIDDIPAYPQIRVVAIY